MGLGYVENKANSVQLQLQLPTGTELGKKAYKRKKAYVYDLKWAGIRRETKG